VLWSEERRGTSEVLSGGEAVYLWRLSGSSSLWHSLLA